MRVQREGRGPIRFGRIYRIVRGAINDDLGSKTIDYGGDLLRACDVQLAAIERQQVMASRNQLDAENTPQTARGSGYDGAHKHLTFIEGTQRLRSLCASRSSSSNTRGTRRIGLGASNLHGLDTTAPSAPGRPRMAPRARSQWRA